MINIICFNVRIKDTHNDITHKDNYRKRVKSIIGYLFDYFLHHTYGIFW